MVEIGLSRGLVAVVDDADAALVGSYTWHAFRAKSKEYARANLPRNRNRPRLSPILMHRLIMGFPLKQIDHRNGDGLDNRRSNLRLATGAQNNANQRVGARGGTSRFKGVILRSHGRWTAQIGVGTKYLGTFDSEEEAALAYNAAALAEWGEFAALNDVVGKI